MHPLRSKLHHRPFCVVFQHAGDEVYLHEGRFTRDEVIRDIEGGHLPDVVAIYKVIAMRSLGVDGPCGPWIDITDVVAERICNRSEANAEQPSPECVAFLEAHGYDEFWREPSVEDAIGELIDHHYGKRIGSEPA